MTEMNENCVIKIENLSKEYRLGTIGSGKMCIRDSIEDAFRFSRMVVIAPSYDGGVFPIMNDFLHHLKIKGYKNREDGVAEIARAPVVCKVEQV